MNLALKVLSFFFPELCHSCGNPLKPEESLFCAECRKSLKRVRVYCRRCGELFSEELPSWLEERELFGCKTCEAEKVYLDRVFLGFRYAEPISQLIERAKFEGDFVLAYKLGRLLRLVLPSLPFDFDLACAVPLSVERLRERGYNQAELMLWGYLGKRPKPNPLRRIKHTRPQTELSRKERLENVKSAFSVEGNVAGLKVLLFDDVMTTGATLRECAKALKKAGAKEVVAIALARA